MNIIPNNVNVIPPPPAGFLNNILPGGIAGSMSVANNPMGPAYYIFPTGMPNNILPGATGDGISITLDSPNNCYNAGSVVSGRVIVQMDKPENIRSLSVKIKGGANVTWTETREETKSTPATGCGENLNTARETETITTTYTSEEEYFSNKFYLLGENQIQAGTHAFQFTTPLPSLLPSSFSGKYGRIKYTIQATINRSSKVDHTAELEFKVVTPKDLNNNAVAKEPVKKEVSKNFCCLFCQSGPLTLVAALPYRGYVAGQPINIAIEADNASNVKIDSVLVKLNKEINWKCHVPERMEKNTYVELAKVKMEGVDAHGSKTWSQQISFPADMQCTNIGACSLIKIKHVLEVVAEVGGCHQNLELEIPLVLGTVPIQDGGGIGSMFPNAVPNPETGGSSNPFNPAINVGPNALANPETGFSSNPYYPAMNVGPNAPANPETGGFSNPFYPATNLGPHAPANPINSGGPMPGYPPPPLSPSAPPDYSSSANQPLISLF